MNRTKAREYAFILLFQYKFQPAEIGQILDDFCKEYNPKDREGYIRSVVLNATENIEQIDKIIAEKSEGWGVERLSSVNLSVLRLSVTEMLYLPDVPRVVSVNEAVGLAKTYDGEESVDFVNGVLDKIKNSL